MSHGPLTMLFMETWAETGTKGDSRWKNCQFSIGAANRDANSATLDASAFAGKEVHTYLAFISEDEQDASGSVYTGSVQL